MKGRQKMRRWRNEQTEGFCSPEAECKAMQLNSFNHLSSLHLWKPDRRIDRLSVCVGPMLSAHSSITSAFPGSSIYWWLEKHERYEAEESVCYTNQFLTGEWTWRILAGRRMECVCLLPWGPEFTMWVLLFKEHRQLWIVLKIAQMLQNPYNIWVYAHVEKNVSMTVLDEFENDQ